MMKTFKEIQHQQPSSQTNKSFLTITSKMFVSVLAVCTLLIFTGSGFAQEPYKLSVVPQFPALVIHDDWQPLLDYLQETVGVEFELSLQDTIPLFEVDFLEGNPDFIFLNPYHEVMAHQAHGYEPLLSDGSRQLKGILVVAASSDINKVEDLDATTVAFPAPNAFGASLYMRALLANEIGIEISPNYVDTHANSYRHVLIGDAAAGGGVYNTLRKETDDFQSALRVLYETPGVTPHPLAVHPRVPESVREAVINAVLELSESEEGRELLQAIQLKEPVRVSYEEHYQILENYNLEDFIVNAE